MISFLINFQFSQIQAFRMLRSKHGQLTHNARPVQELSGRPVWYNVGGFAHLNEPNTSNGLTLGFSVSNIVMLLCCKLATLMLL